VTKLKLELPDTLEVELRDGQVLTGRLTFDGRFRAVLDDAPPSPEPAPEPPTPPSPTPSPVEPSWKTTAIPEFKPMQGSPAQLDLAQSIDNFDVTKHQVQVKTGTLPTGDTINPSSVLLYDGVGPAAPVRDVFYHIADKAPSPSPGPSPGPSPSPTPTPPGDAEADW